MTTQTMNPAQVQDSLRSVRNFLSLISGATSDQPNPYQDGLATGGPGQFQVTGPNGQVAIEGQPLIHTQAPENQPNYMPMMMLGMAAIVLVLILK